MTLLKEGNKKLAKDIGIWSLPRSTCIGAGECRKYCYDRARSCIWAVQHSRDIKLALSRTTEFVDLMVDEITNRKYRLVRIHEVGDFYSNEYLDKWKSIAGKCPDTVFLSYTKSLNLDLWNNKPRNLVIFQSVGGKFDNMIDWKRNTARVLFNNKYKKNEYVCPYRQSNFYKCGISCDYCWNIDRKLHVAFVAH